jgi:uncharacterized protein (TIGR02118 family)
MIKLSGTWHIPDGQSAEENDAHYFAVHVPNVRRLPKLRRHVVLKTIDWPEGTHAACYRGADIFFDNREDFDAAIASPEWAAIEADGFMPSVAGLQIEVFDVEDEFILPDAPAPGRAPEGSTVTCLRGTWHIPNGMQPTEIDPHYFGVHVPNVRSLPSLARHVVLKTIEWPAGSHPRSWRGAETWATTHEDFDTQIASDEWAKVEVDGFMPSVAGLHIDVFDVEQEWVPDGAA